MSLIYKNLNTLWSNTNLVSNGISTPVINPDNVFLVNNATYKSINIDLSTAKAGGPSPNIAPLFTNMSGLTCAYMFQNQNESLYFSCNLPNDWKEGTSVTPVLHCFAIDVVVNAILNLNISVGSIDNEFDQLTATQTVISIDSNNTFKHKLDFFPQIEMTNNKILTQLLCRLSCVVENLPVGVFVPSIDFIYQSDSLGSMQKYTKI